MDNFVQNVYTVVHSIPEGKVATYGQIAKLAGFPGYARHVGKALCNLPEDSRLPWYRVINSQGKISLTGADYQRQQQKLLAEGIEFSHSGRINLKKFAWQL